MWRGVGRGVGVSVGQFEAKTADVATAGCGGLSGRVGLGGRGVGGQRVWGVGVGWWWDGVVGGCVV